ncbi:MAG: biotin attachment protein, partial [Firmicutes bacterium]|nr:biotin attachment protein [Bacillota bacterium]
NQDFAALDQEQQKELLNLFNQVPGDFKNLLLGHYGKLPMGWPDEWMYKSAFGRDWREALASREEESPLDLLDEENLHEDRQVLEELLGRQPSQDEFILYLMHPKDATNYFEFRTRFGEAPYVLPTNVWREGLRKTGDTVEFDINGKPFSIELVSIGAEHEGVIHVIMRVNNKTRVYTVNTPRVKKTKIRMAKGITEVASPINGTLWRLGNPKRGVLKMGDIVHKGEEIANIEAMKMETSILAPYDAQVVDIGVKVNDIVSEGQLLFVLEKID